MANKVRFGELFKEGIGRLAAEYGTSHQQLFEKLAERELAKGERYAANTIRSWTNGVMPGKVHEIAPNLARIIIKEGRLNNEEFTYQGSRSFALPGRYFAEPVRMYTNGEWGGIYPYTHIFFYVITPTTQMAEWWQVDYFANPNLNAPSVWETTEPEVSNDQNGYDLIHNSAERKNTHVEIL
jgi:hypothetical protein